MPLAQDWTRDPYRAQRVLMLLCFYLGATPSFNLNSPRLDLLLPLFTLRLSHLQINSPFTTRTKVPRLRRR